ncbi:5'-nucleotidase, lipoprotein e(P4) family [Sediminibacterium soli]|uniref:5'-nucleotidase, lipoprotein e(P4) family n=1 Tax=Sediminibacterium soli TaxID=2698829 RepID=UPI00137A2BC7|nr:5'-nucleotidase, lipoprotein e(P4) family [Sediminibacterium soli]NCI45444.1 5'-nucleotidase, lipoprotein e(P4) family [Sediminibacterium soli]
MKAILASALSLLILSAAAQEPKPVFRNDRKLLPVLWQQYAAEYRALCYQAFNIATERIARVKKKRRGRLAIVTDIDETLLDNSYSEAQLLKEGKSYSQADWKRWTDLSAATEVPGASEFLRFAKDRGISIFYISNRDTSETESTIRNLQKLRFPDADREHMLLLQNTSSKESRRQTVQQTHRIVMLLGDNLNDFARAFEKADIRQRFLETDTARAEWGRRFIVLPNATYGEWENALLQYQRNLPEQQKDSVYFRLLKGY